MSATSTIIPVPCAPDPLPDPYPKETIVQWLSRPFPIGDFSWTATNVANSSLGSIRFPQIFFSVEALMDKLNNFQYMRCNLEISVRMNGTRFHYGRLLFAYRPLEPTSVGGDYLNTYINNTSLSACPHVIVSPTDNEVVTMKLPYVRPYSWIDITAAASATPAVSDTIGTLYIMVLNPLAMAGTVSPVSFTIYGRMVDVELAGYCGDRRTVIPAEFVTQGKEGEEKSSKGLISGVAEKVETVATIVSELPLGVVSEVSAGIAGAASMVGTVAQAMGYSNPVSLQASSPYIMAWDNYANSRGLNQARVLSVDPDNKVSPCLDIIGSNSKDMSILPYMQNQGYIQTFPWVSTKSVRASLFLFSISPLLLPKRTSSITPPTLTMSHIPLSFVAAAASYWRGSITIRLDFVASGFHSGRVRVLWTPTNALPSNGLPNYISHIVDLQNQTRLDFVVPYLARTPWLSVGQDKFITLGNINGEGDSSNTNGRIWVYVVNPLTYPDVTVPPVSINLWAGAGPDFQLAKPLSSYLSTLHVVPTTKDDVQKKEFVTQGEESVGLAEGLIPATGSKDIGFLMGEELISFKDFTSRPMVVLSNFTQLGLEYVPDAAIPNGSNYTVQSPANDAVYINYFQYFSQIFCFWRGSLNIKILPEQPSIVQAVLGDISDSTFKTLGSAMYRPAAYTYQIMNSWSGNGYHVVPSSMFQPFSIVLPFYSQRSCVRTNFVNTLGENPNIGNHNTLRLNVTITGTASVPTYSMFLSTGEDFHFGFPVGPPRLVYA